MKTFHKSDWRIQILNPQFTCRDSVWSAVFFAFQFGLYLMFVRIWSHLGTAGIPISLLLFMLWIATSIVMGIAIRALSWSFITAFAFWLSVWFLDILETNVVPAKSLATCLQAFGIQVVIIVVTKVLFIRLKTL